jgi:hypothetical protein
MANSAFHRPEEEGKRSYREGEEEEEVIYPLIYGFVIPDDFIRRYNEKHLKKSCVTVGLAATDVIEDISQVF